MPVLVAHDETFQVKIIGDGIDKIAKSDEKVIYRPDAILPDPNVENWVVQICDEFAAKVKTKRLPNDRCQPIHLHESSGASTLLHTAMWGIFLSFSYCLLLVRHCIKPYK